jgi:hypothetical protein
VKHRAVECIFHSKIKIPENYIQVWRMEDNIPTNISNSGWTPSPAFGEPLDPKTSYFGVGTAFFPCVNTT